MTDGCAAQIAAGALREGDWNSVLGTTLVLKGCSAATRRATRAGVLYCHRAPGRRLAARRRVEQRRRRADRARSPAATSTSSAGAPPAYEHTRVLAYPLVSRGERFPFAAPDAEAFMLGEPRDEAERYAALLQGVAFVERLCFDYARPARRADRRRADADRRRDAQPPLVSAARRRARPPGAARRAAEAAFGMAILAAAARRRRSPTRAAAMVAHARGRSSRARDRAAQLDEQLPAPRRRARAARLARRARSPSTPAARAAGR